MRLRWRLRTMMVAVAVTGVALGWIAFLWDLPDPKRGPPLSNDATTALMVLIGAGAIGMAYREVRWIAGRGRGTIRGHWTTQSGRVLAIQGGRWAVRRSRGPGPGWRLIAGVLLTGALVFVTRYIDWQSPTNDWLRPLAPYLVGLIAFLSALLIQSFSKQFNVYEVVITTAVVFILGCLLFPAVATDHSHRRERPPQALRPTTSP